jgi:hypothetical protein
MRTRLSAFLTAAALACLTSVVGAQAKPTTATGRGACSSHGGVKKAETSKSESKPATTAAKPKTTAPKPPKPADTTKPKATGKTAGKTAMVKCTDGTMSKGGQGACSSHGGIAKPK